jgi:uncharacterized protein (TIGR02996 family)
MIQDRTELAFLHDICQNPADDAVRLIYADWLDDRGLPGDAERAEFIRAQIEIARSCQEPAAPWADFQLLGRHQCLMSAVDNGEYEFLVPDWTETPDGWWSWWYAEESQIVVACGNSPKHYLFTLHWQRGFIEAISLSLVDFQAHAARLFASHPVQHVALKDREPADRHNIGLQWYYWDAKGPWPLPQDFQAIREALPRVLYDFLPPGKVYASAAEAHNDLSLACVRWGRQQAGLPEGMAEVTA